MNINITRSLILSILWTVIWFLLGNYLFLPTLSLSFGSGIYWYCIFYFFGLGFTLIVEEVSTPSVISWILAIIICLIMFCVWFFGSWRMFHAKEYRALMGDIKGSQFTADIAPISPEQMITVDQSIAERIGGKVIGEDPGLGSRAQLGQFTLQAVKGQLYWIAPLLHSGFFKWNSFKSEGTPGYVVVSATNQEDYRMVREVNGEKLHIRYQPNSCFSQDLERHIYLNGYSSVGYTDYNFEVDDDWKPYWTVTIYDTKIGFDGEDATALLVVDPQSGEMKQHPLSEIPDWVDRVQPETFVQTQADDWGEYVHGWPNWSGRDKLAANYSCSIVLGSDGKVYYYLGLSSKGNEKSTVGFMMVDARTKHTKWYHQAGATEQAAAGSAEGKVQQMGYSASDGITYNIDGIATYEFLLKDKGGLMKQIALVSVHDHNIVGVGETRQQAIRSYRTALASHGNSVSVGPSELEKIVLTSTVERIAADVTTAATNYYIIVDNRNKNIFTANTSVSVQVPLTRVGDKVKITFIENNRQEIELQSFTNLTLNLKSDSVQIVQDIKVDTVRESNRQEKVNKVMDKKWEDLSAEEKREALKK